MNGHIITVSGAKDYSGATGFAVNLSFLLQKLSKKKVVLVDFDLNYPGEVYARLKMTENLCFIKDLVPHIHKNISAGILEGFIPVHKQGTPVLGAYDPKDAECSRENSQNTFNKVVHFLKQAFDYIVIDTGAVWTPCHGLPLTNASLNYVITNPDTSCIAQARQKISQLIHLYVPKNRIAVILNRYIENTGIKNEFCTSFENYFTNTLPNVESGMSQSQVSGTPLVIQDVRSPYTHELEQIVSQSILNAELSLPQAGKASPSSQAFSRIQRFFSGEIVEANENYETIPEPVTQAEDAAWLEIKEKVLKRLLQEVDIKSINIDRRRDKGADLKLRENTTDAILKIVNDIGSDTVPFDKRKTLVNEILDEAIGLGPLESLLADKNITEIMINGKDQIFVEKKGRLSQTSLKFTSASQLNTIIERIVAPIGRRVDESTPLVDARLSDGSRVNIIIPPLSLIGPVITIRRFSETPLEVNDLIGFGSLNEGMASFLKAAIQSRLNVIVSGGTGSGKTTLLNVLSSFIPNDERIVTLEDAAELRLHQDHVVSLESRPPNLENKGAITIRSLLKNSLRMRPDRIIVGECRGEETLDMLQAMNTGHDGSLTTIHANTPRDCISRLETLVMYSGMQLPSRAIRSQIASAINIIIQLNRLSDGTRRITNITEITGMEGDVITAQDIFKFEQTGIDAEKKVIGTHKATGVIPSFIETLKQKGIELSYDSFK